MGNVSKATAAQFAKKTRHIILILPAGRNSPPEQINIPPKQAGEIPHLPAVLMDHHIEDTVSYTGLIDAGGKSLDPAAVTRLLETRSGIKVRKVIFTGPNSFPALVADIFNRVDDDTKSPKPEKKLYEMLEEDSEDHEHCDCETDQPDAMLKLTDEVKGFVKAHGDSKKSVPREKARFWVTGMAGAKKIGPPLNERMTAVAEQARVRGIFFHEPHHDLTPGMLLLEEIFRALVSDVLALIDPTKPIGGPTLATLQEAVNGLASGTGLFGQYGAYILRAGDFLCHNGTHRYHVDPARIELFLDEDSKVVATAVIVGAWAGGTHSSGHIG